MTGRLRIPSNSLLTPHTILTQKVLDYNTNPIDNIYKMEHVSPKRRYLPTKYKEL
jgi:hypothetical protein